MEIKKTLAASPQPTLSEGDKTFIMFKGKGKFRANLPFPSSPIQLFLDIKPK
ncbi:MAG: hypothetical protein ACYTEN_10255 [Planctomycetota bacterium]